MSDHIEIKMMVDAGNMRDFFSSILQVSNNRIGDCEEMDHSLQAQAHKEGLATVRQVAEFLSLSRSTIYNLMEKGDLGWVHIGKARRITWAEVDRLVAKNTMGGWNVD